MIVIETSAHVHRPVADTFRFVADGFFEHLKLWNPDLVEMKKLSEGPVAKGTTGFEAQVIRGKRYSRSFEITRYEQDRVFEVTGTGSAFAPDGAGTRLDYRFELMWPSFMFRFLPFLARHFIAKDLRRNIGEKLKGAAEK
jgi:hypothetical protein